jgi:cold shock protein
MRGTIADISPERGFGFIAAPDGGEYFFHRSALQATEFEELAPGIEVEFEVNRESGDRPNEGPRAVNVRLADEAIPAVDHEVLPAEKTR